MDSAKLKSLVSEENARLEQEAADNARRLIRQIADDRQGIAAANDRIAACQAELRKLQVEQLDETSILGS